MKPRVNWRALPRRAFPYLLVAVGGFLIAYLAIFLFAFPAEVLPDEGILPNVVGMTFEDASAALDKAGFHAQKGQARYHKRIGAGLVLQEDPPAGSRQKRGTDVVLAVSSGQRTAQVPQLLYMTQQQARIAIENTGLTVGTVTARVGDQPRGLILESDPPAGSQLALPSAVNLVISEGPSVVPVPDLVGRTVGEARSMVEQLGLRVAGITRDTSSLQPENTVIGQLPAAGQNASAGGPVSLRISRFPQQQPLAPIDTSPPPAP